MLNLFLVNILDIFLYKAHGLTFTKFCENLYIFGKIITFHNIYIHAAVAILTVTRDAPIRQSRPIIGV